MSTSDAAAIPKLAFKISEAVSATGIGETSLCEDIAAGLLKVKKRGRSTLILAEDLTSYLRALPDGRTQ